MIYLGSNRIVTQDYASHKYAEDYAGNHGSIIKMYGRGKVTKIVNKFKSHEHSINYNTFLNNQSKWKDGNIYHCTSITGTKVDMNYDELGGNQVYVETYGERGELLTFHFAHLDTVSVKVGDIVDSNTILGTQGNTGLVLSNKSTSDKTYGSHVHFEIRNKDGVAINPRNYANANIVTNYQTQTNQIDKDKKQFKVMVDSINIRKEPNTSSKILGAVYLNEVYTILEEVDSNEYTWYKILTGRNVSGFVASKKNANWVEIMNVNEDIKPDIEVPDEEIKEEEKENIVVKYKLLFTCKKSGMYYLNLNAGEELYIKEK